jgi:photosystem II stability/assembly factor-like uncharacterized protein
MIIKQSKTQFLVVCLLMAVLTVTSCRGPSEVSPIPTPPPLPAPGKTPTPQPSPGPAPTLPCTPSAAPEQANVNLWHPIGPFGGSIYAIAIDPANCDRVYVGTYGGGLFKSEDGGESWEPINEGLGDNRVTAITLDPGDPATIYAGTDESGVFKSVDGGHHWAEMNHGLKQHWYQFIRQIVVDPTDSETLYMGGHGVYKSNNRGKNWSLVSEEHLGNGFVHLAMHPSDPNVVYAGTYMGGVFKTEDGGASWGEANNGLTYSQVNGIAIDPSRPATVYVVNQDGVFNSTNGGENWSCLREDICHSLALNLKNPQVIYVGTRFDGVFKSEDGGLHWSPTGAELSHTQVNALAIDPSQPDIVYAGSHRRGLFKSCDGGDHWVPCNNGLVNTLVKTVAIDPADPDILYVGTFGDGLFKTSDGGESWIGTNDGLTNSYIKSILVRPDSHSTVYVGTWDGLFKSDDAGAHWEEISQGLTNRRVMALAIDPKNTTVIYAGTYGGGIFKSDNAGASWTLSSRGLTITYVESLVIDPTNPSTLYAGTYAGIFKSIDRGDSWHEVSDGLRTKNVRSLALNPSSCTLYASTADGVYQSTDGAETWHAISDSLTSDYYRSVVLTSSNSETVFTASWDGVFMSCNRGDSWVSLQNGMINARVMSLAVHPSHPDTLYAGTYGAGVCIISLACSGMWGMVRDAETNRGIGYARVSTDHGGYSTRADINGYFILPYVVEESYTLTAEVFGYRTSTSSSVRARVNEWVRVDLALTPGGRYGDVPGQEEEKGYTAIVTPWLDLQFMLGERIPLVGKIAVGGIAPENLTAKWSSNLSGDLGTSRVDSNGTTSITTRFLDGGEHMITLEISDHDDIVGMTWTYVNVREATDFHAIGLAWDGRYMWAVTEPGDSRLASIYKLDISGAVTIVDVYTHPSPCPTGVTWDGHNLLISGHEGPDPIKPWEEGHIYLYKHSMDDVLSIANKFAAPPEPENFRCPTIGEGLAWDGVYLWSVGSDKIIKYQVMDQSLVMIAFYEAPTTEMKGATWDGTSLWTTSASTDRLYRHNMDDLSVAAAYEVPVDYPSGLAWDGTSFWTCGTYPLTRLSIEQLLPVE